MFCGKKNERRYIDLPEKVTRGVVESETFMKFCMDFLGDDMKAKDVKDLNSEEFVKLQESVCTALANENAYGQIKARYDQEFLDEAVRRVVEKLIARIDDENQPSQVRYFIRLVADDHVESDQEVNLYAEDDDEILPQAMHLNVRKASEIVRQLQSKHKNPSTLRDEVIDQIMDKYLMIFEIQTDEFDDHMMQEFTLSMIEILILRKWGVKQGRVAKSVVLEAVDKFAPDYHLASFEDITKAVEEAEY